jgi:Uma2 family endonuclease
MALPIPKLHPVTVNNIPIGGSILATEVSHEEFMQGFEGQRVEWVNGTVVEMPSITEKHDKLTRFLATLLEYFLERTAGGTLCQDPMVMKLVGISSRAPDILVLTAAHLDRLQTNIVIGAADLVIEIVSPGSQRTDRIEKFGEYEAGGVPEYWLFDPQYRETLFYQLDEEGEYQRIAPDDDGIYHSKILPGLKIHLQWLWRNPLPGVAERVQLWTFALEMTDIE